MPKQLGARYIGGTPKVLVECNQVGGPRTGGTGGNQVEKIRQFKKK